jgi:hypothetical protein
MQSPMIKMIIKSNTSADAGEGGHPGLPFVPNIQSGGASVLKKWWGKYTEFIKSTHALNPDSAESEINQCKDRLFITFLVYCLPVSFMAVIPGLFMCFITGNRIVGIADVGWRSVPTSYF